MPIIRGMRRISISVFAFCIAAALIAPQSAAAQAFPAPAAEVFRQEGLASWYGAQFEGRPTASGEIFDSSLFTAAHPTLPFGTFLIVTNRNNNRQVSVRVNDRGPFVEGRIIDVSQAAAEHLGMIVTGTAPVIIETIPAQGRPPAPQQPAFAQPPAPAQPQQPAFAQPAAPQQPAQPQQPAFAQPPAPQPAPQQVTPVHVGTTTVPVDAPQNTPITINIFHTPHDLSQPPTVVVAPAEPQAPPRAAAAPAPQAAAAAPRAQPPADAWGTPSAAVAAQTQPIPVAPAAPQQWAQPAPAAPAPVAQPQWAQPAPQPAAPAPVAQPQWAQPAPQPAAPAAQPQWAQPAPQPAAPAPAAQPQWAQPTPQAAPVAQPQWAQPAAPMAAPLAAAPAQPATPAPQAAAHEAWPAPAQAAAAQPSPWAQPAAPMAAPQAEALAAQAAALEAWPVQPAAFEPPVPIISANPSGMYRVQVGSFRVARNAVDTFVRLRAADFEPSYERNGEFFRVVLAGIRGTEIQSTVERLAAMGHHGVVVMGE